MARRSISVAVVLAVCAAAAPAYASFPGGNGAIVYSWFGASAYRAGPTATSIRTVQPTSGLVRVLRDCPLHTDTPTAYTDCSVTAPRFSPDGQTIAFPSVQITPDFNGQAWRSVSALSRMAADGTGLQDHATESRYWALAWAPAGDRLLLERELSVAGVVPSSLFLASLDGTESRQVAPAWSTAPDWSSTGEIAFVRDRGADPGCKRNCQEIFTTRLGGTPRRLTYRGGTSPSWSPHGTKLAFARSGRRPGIYIVRRDGRGLRRLARVGGGDPVWSPDGRWIAFLRSGDIYVVRPTGRRLTRLVDAGWDGLDGPRASSLDWQPLPRR